jgi:hypothetical protein
VGESHEEGRNTFVKQYILSAYPISSKFKTLEEGKAEKMPGRFRQGISFQKNEFELFLECFFSKIRIINYAGFAGLCFHLARACREAQGGIDRCYIPVLVL